jgi:adenylate cyclase
MPAGAISKQAAHLPKWVEALQHVPEGLSAASRSAAVLIIDIAGFTAMTNRVSGDGAEGLTSFINDCFVVLTDVIVSYAGDIVAFAGDAILAVWDSEDPAEAVESAARCGLALRAALASDDTNRIGHRTAIEVGQVSFCKLGGRSGDWRYVAVGDPFFRIGAAYRTAEIGEVALCPNAAALLADRAEVEPSRYGMRLLRMRQQDEGVAPPSIPPSVVSRGSGWPDGEAWVGEFRTLTVVRIGLAELSFAGDFLPRIQTLVVDAQEIAEHLEGTIHQVLMDDKGLTVTLIFGLAPFAHEDDPLRAVESSLRIRRQLNAKGVATSIGISTGRLFCSNYGGRNCKTYGVFGQAMNVAAQIAEAVHNDIACDAPTAQAVGRRIAFSLLPQVHLKSSSVAMLAFSPIAPADEYHHHSVNGMIGRTSEQAMLKRCLEDVAIGTGKLVLISGEAGIGKSRLLEDFVSAAEAKDYVVLFGSATAIEKSTPYFAWRTILRQALKFESAADAARIRAELSKSLSGETSLLSWLPLLDSVIALGFAETPFTAQIIGSARASAIEDLVIFILRNSAARILVLEDLHWSDGSSTDLLAAVARRLQEFLVVVSQRTLFAKIADDSIGDDLVPSLKIRLDKLSRDEVEQIIKQRLRVNEVPAQLIKIIDDSANGNPFYCEELVLALRDTDQIQVSHGICAFDEKNYSLNGLSLPTSVERAIVSRIDVLSADDQLLLKAASAIGESFSIDMLENAFPDLIASSTETSVRRLIEHDFLQADPEFRPLSFGFRHSITMEVAYNLLSFAQRRTLHARIASFIERFNADDLQPHYARLARHWELGNDLVRTLRYLELASRESRDGYANRESIRYAEKMFELTKRGSIDIDVYRRAGWEVILGDAFHELSDYENSAEHYARAMQLMGRRIPAGRARKIGALAMNGAAQFVSRILPANPARLDEAERGGVQLMSHIYEYLSEQYFFQNDSLAVLNGTLASLNLAERSGAAPETTRGYTALALGMAMSGLVKVARSYGQRAQHLAEKHGSLPDIARVELVLGVLDYGLGMWSDAEQHADKALTLYRRLGDRARAQMSETMAIFVAVLRGDILRADVLLTDLYSDISPDSSVQVRAWSLSARVLIDTILGNTSAQHLSGLRAIAGCRLIRTDQLLCYGVAAMAYLQRQEIDSAMELAERGLAVLQECGVVWGGYVFGAAGVADVFLGLCESGHDFRGGRPHIQKQADLACRQLSRLARTSPICRPYALLMQGRASLLAHRAAQARNEWERAAKAAESLQMPREQARAIYQIGKNSAIDDPRRHKHLGKASEIFGRLGAVGELAQLRRTENRQPIAAVRGRAPWPNEES